MRDMPNDAQVHISAIRRIEAIQTYRPGNLILGGGGKVAPKKAGIGEWITTGNAGDTVGERVIRKPKDEEVQKTHTRCNS